MRKGLFFVAGALMAVSAMSPAFAEGGCAWSTKQMSVEAPKVSAPMSTAASGTIVPPSTAQTGG